MVLPRFLDVPWSNHLFLDMYHDITMAKYHGYQTFAMVLWWFYDMAGHAPW